SFPTLTFDFATRASRKENSGFLVEIRSSERPGYRRDERGHRAFDERTHRHQAHRREPVDHGGGSAVRDTAGEKRRLVHEAETRPHGGIRPDNQKPKDKIDENPGQGGGH